MIRPIRQLDAVKRISPIVIGCQERMINSPQNYKFQFKRANLCVFVKINPSAVAPLASRIVRNPGRRRNEFDFDKSVGAVDKSMIIL